MYCAKLVVAKDLVVFVEDVEAEKSNLVVTVICTLDYSWTLLWRDDDVKVTFIYSVDIASSIVTVFLDEVRRSRWILDEW